MWVEQTKKGKYKYIERYTDPLTGKYRRVSVTLDKDTPQSRKQAQKAISKKIEDAEKDVCANSEDITLEELIEKYKTQLLPAIILIPGVSGNTGAGVRGVKKSVEQAVGSDILFGSEEE